MLGSQPQASQHIIKYQSAGVFSGDGNKQLPLWLFEGGYSIKTESLTLPAGRRPRRVSTKNPGNNHHRKRQPNCSLKHLRSYQGNLFISFIPRTVTGSPLGRVSLWKLTGYNPLSRSTERKAYSDSIYTLGVLPVSAVWQGKRWELWRKIRYSPPPIPHTFKMASPCPNR